MEGDVLVCPTSKHPQQVVGPWETPSVAELRTLQDPEARSDLGPTQLLGPRLGGTFTYVASARGSTEPRWQFGEKLVSGLKTAGSRRISL